MGKQFKWQYVVNQFLSVQLERLCNGGLAGHAGRPGTRHGLQETEAIKSRLEVAWHCIALHGMWGSTVEVDGMALHNPWACHGTAWGSKGMAWVCQRKA